MGHPTNVVPLRCAGSDAYDPDRLRLRPDEAPSAKADTGAQAKRRAARDRLFVPSIAWLELAAVIAAGVSGRAVGLWLAARMQSKLEGADWMGGCARTCARASGSPTVPSIPARSRRWNRPASSRYGGARTGHHRCS